MALFLGIDGGGTGCRAAVADASGRILGTGVAGPANLTSDPAGTRANILAATRAALAAAVGPDAGEAELTRLVAGLGLAGANTTGASLDLPFAKLRLETDAVTAVKGALWGGDGIVAAIGTGSVFASQRNGVIRQVGGWGLVLGDEGSGAWLGRSLLARALRAVD
ncbi:MAG TPA: BadF/BadG/BcrA/BcrD ATPase family protein, partial [Tabrizicola sp.]|nr:BadF/BadG/BcrA/BcrD ATPase family protein [Tabrizicola sp.]